MIKRMTFLDALMTISLIAFLLVLLIPLVAAR